MKALNKHKISRKYSYGFGQLALTILSLFALAATFFLAVSDFSFNTKVVSFAGILLIYLGVCISFYFRQTDLDGAEGPVPDSEDDAAESEIENRLFALEEANRYFGTSLKPADMFRLVASRVKELVPFAACVLLYIDERTLDLKAAYSDGDNSELLKDPSISYGKGIAGKAAVSRKPQIDEGLLIERSVAPAAALETFGSVIAVPLFKGLEVFGVLQLYSNKGQKFEENTLSILEAISERAAPLFLSSQAFERTLSNAMTDSLTNLPNERAFYLLLENQVAESQRYRDERPLTILAIDVRNFAELNQQFGHATGDRMLSFASEIIKGQLRKMDFLARSMSDEFLAVLPTAAEKVAIEIIERIERVLVTTPFEISDKEYTNIQFNFGWAGFWKDGETAQQLLQNALLRKQQSKSIEPSKVLWFPREYVN